MANGKNAKALSAEIERLEKKYCDDGYTPSLNEQEAITAAAIVLLELRRKK